MNFAGDHYYKLCRVILTSLALWPYQKTTWYRPFQRVFLTVILVSGTVIQANTCATTECNSEHLLKILPFITVTLSFVVKYISFLVIMDNIKALLDRIQYDWNTIKNEKELEILQGYTHIAKSFTSIFAVFIYLAAGSVVVSQYLPHILDIVVPLNESRKYESPVQMEYFLDENKYFFPINLHVDTVIIAGASALLATEGLMMMFVYHSCGLLEIVSYRIKTTFDADYLRRLSSGKEDQRDIHEKIVDIVNGHRGAYEFLDHLMTTFSRSYFISIGLGVSTLALNLFRLRQAILVRKDMDEVVTTLVNVSANVVYTFFFNHMGQEIIDRSSVLFENLYDTSWYQAPRTAQNSLLIIMERCMKNKGFVLGGIFMVSYEGFSTMTRMAASYFMVISSTM